MNPESVERPQGRKHPGPGSWAAAAGGQRLSLGGRFPSVRCVRAPARWSLHETGCHRDTSEHLRTRLVCGRQDPRRTAGGQGVEGGVTGHHEEAVLPWEEQTTDVNSPPSQCVLVATGKLEPHPQLSCVFIGLCVSDRRVCLASRCESAVVGRAAAVGRAAGSGRSVFCSAGDFSEKTAVLVPHFHRGHRAALEITVLGGCPGPGRTECRCLPALTSCCPPRTRSRG